MDVVIEKLRTDVAELKQEMAQLEKIVIDSFDKILIAVEKLEAMH